MLLQDLDQVHSLFDRLEATGLNLLPEQGRFKSVQSRLKTRVNLLLRALGGAAALDQYRPVPEPSRERWWWYIHEMVAVQQRRLIHQISVGLVIILLLVGGVVLAFNTVLAPSPETLARVEAENEAFAAVEQGNYREALSSVDKGLAKIPGNPHLLMLQGALYEILGEENQAEKNFAQARSILNDPLAFYLTGGQLQLRLNQPQRAESDARAALELDENVAMAWLLLGQALEFQGRKVEAIPAYEKASRLAVDSGDNEIVVLARLALARLGSTPQ